MQNLETFLDPYPHATTISEVPGLRVRRCSFSVGRPSPWHQKTSSSTTFFCHSGSLSVQIKKPPFRCTLKPGQTYTVPALVTVSAYTNSPTATCTVFEYGEKLEAIAEGPPNLGQVFDRPDPIEDPTPSVSRALAFSYDALEAGFSRMDVIATPPGLRLIAQGHGKNQCVPWHSHDHISDTFFCLSGTVRIATRTPDEIVELSPGQTHTVQPKTAHFVSGVGGEPCQMFVLQGVGNYNYVAR